MAGPWEKYAPTSESRLRDRMFTPEENREIIAREVQPDAREMFRAAIVAERDPQARKILEAEYQRDVGRAERAAVQMDTRPPWEKYTQTTAEQPEQLPQIGRAGFLDQVRRGLGLMARSSIEGALSPASTVLGGLYGAYNVGADVVQGPGQGFRFKDPGQQLSQTLTQTGLPTAQSDLEKVADFGTQVLAGAAAMPIPASKTPVPAPKLTVKDVSTQKVQDAGYTIPPSLSGGNVATDALESVGGKAAIKQQATLQNQEVTNALARKAAGLGPNDEITREALRAARDEMSEPYRQIAAISQRASTALERLKKSRHEAQVYWKSYNRSANPEHLEKAKRLDAANDLLESVIEKEASRAGAPELVESLKAARISIARNFDVERALNTDTGEVSAKVIGRLADKKRVGGELATIASFAKTFPQVAGEGARTMAPGVSHSDALAAAGLGVLGGPMAAGLPLARGPARAIALSKWLQQPPARALNPEELALRARVRAALATRGYDVATEE